MGRGPKICGEFPSALDRGRLNGLRKVYLSIERALARSLTAVRDELVLSR